MPQTTIFDGFLGFLDFTGLPSGQALALPTPIGFSGFLDFTGLPVAAGTGIVIIPHGHGFRGAGYYYVAKLQYEEEQKRRRLLQETRRRERLPTERLAPQLVRIVMERQQEALLQHREAVQQKRLAENAMYAVLLAEI